MKRFIIYFLLLLASIWIGLKINKDPGYVLVTYQHWSLETTLWFAILAILVFYLLLAFILKFWRSTALLSEKFNHWLAQRHSHKANKFTYQGLCQLAEGEWKKAEKNLLRGADHSEMPLVNYLAAAEAAQKLGHFEDRDDYLRLAHTAAPQAEVAIGLSQAQLQLNAKQWELALATLRRLHQLVPDHNYVLLLLKSVYLELHDWAHLKDLLPALRKNKVLDAEAYERLEQEIYQALLQNVINTGDGTLVTENWENLPRQYHYQPALLSLYVNYLIQHNEGFKAEFLLKDALKKNWDPGLVSYYGLVQGENPDKQLATAENWLKTNPNNASLLLCLGRLCVRNNLWGKAKDYLSASIDQEPKAENFFELGKLLEQQGDSQEALQCYRQGLQKAVG